MSETSVVAGVVLHDQSDRYLMVQELKASAYGLWNIPAGHANEGETPQEAAIREAKEEVGYTVELESDKPLYCEADPHKDRTFYAFLARITGGEMELQKDEILDAKWLKINEIEKMMTNGEIRAPWVMSAILKAESYENSGH